ncbi:hypothetical protein MKD38_10205 [Cupriavidus sp. WGlv3]|uniref:hypothetical protein n=1 Tax=Cupriavidus sp. WGlv3 TaxID=2919924 RepID=UPI002090FC01|nr:hypothetical protein [Cupriavidus sp. WGlv3]MCO4862047.1 hypothetical protein [Cupriavidus sp. WGlv3]
MKVVSHLEKVAKLQALRERLDPLQDFELWFWAGMTAGTHAVNAALHQAGITLDEDMFPTQPGVYLVPQPDGGLKAALRPLGDVLHVGRPKVEAPVPADIAAMMEDMERIEHYRDPCLREGLTPTQAIAQSCDAALQRCLGLLAQRMEGGAHGH